MIRYIHIVKTYIKTQELWKRKVNLKLKIPIGFLYFIWNGQWDFNSILFIIVYACVFVCIFNIIIVFNWYLIKCWSLHSTTKGIYYYYLSLVFILLQRKDVWLQVYLLNNNNARLSSFVTAAEGISWLCRQRRRLVSRRLYR